MGTTETSADDSIDSILESSIEEPTDSIKHPQKQSEQTLLNNEILEICENPLEDENVIQIQESDLVEISSKLSNKALKCAVPDLKGMTFAHQKIQTRPGMNNVESILADAEEKKAIRKA